MSDPTLEVVNRPVHFWSGFSKDIGEIFHQRELLSAFVRREFRSRYKGAKLGWVWALIKPLVTFLVYSLAVGVFLGAGKTIPEFGIYLYVGLTAWTLFSQIVSGSINSITGNADLIRKAAFPRELLIVAVVITALFDFVIQMSILVAGYALYRNFPAPGQFVWLIPSLLVIGLFGVSLGLLLSVANARIRDVGFLTDVGLQIGFWLVPIIYSYQAVAEAFAQLPLLNSLYLANPITNALFGMRATFWPPASANEFMAYTFQGSLGLRLAVLIAIGIILLFIAQRVFRIRAANLAQEI